MYIKKVIHCFLMFFFCVTFSPLPAHALPGPVPAVPAPSSVPAKGQPESEGLDIVLLMDSSGSMRKTDPHNYRKDAAKLMISLLGHDDRIGIVSFGDAAKTLLPLTQNQKENRGKFFAAVKKISSKEFSTHIFEGVQTGYEELKKSQRKNRILLLMSDGKLTLGSKEKEEAAHAALTKLLPELAKQNIKLYSVAFTDLSDVKLLENLAKETGGFFRFAKADKDVHVMFASMFEKMKSPDSIPLEGETFTIDKNIREAVLLITKKAGTSTVLTDPAGGKSTAARFAKNIKWYEAKVFDMITISEPAVGKWKVKLSSKEGNRVFVLTNLRLRTSFDRSFVGRGEAVTIDAWLEKEGGAVTEKTVLEKVAFGGDLTSPDSKPSKLDLADTGREGKYAGKITASSSGEYVVKLTAEGKTFKRERVLHFKAAEQPAAPPVEKKAAPASEPKKKAAEEAVPWRTIMIQFGLINLSLLGIIGVVFLVKWIAAKRKGKGGRE
jgi:Mg-chelatase subunit ChlD